MCALTVGMSMWHHNFLSALPLNLLRNLLFFVADLETAEANYEKAKQELDTTLKELGEM